MTQDQKDRLAARRAYVVRQLERANGEYAMELESELTYLNNVLKEG